MNKLIVLVLAIFLSTLSHAQNDSTDLDKLLEAEMNAEDKNKTEFVTAAFKTTRLINGHSTENVARRVLDIKISHRFGTLNGGAYELFGLDNATMRMGGDYGISDNLMIGAGRNTFEKTYDAFFKWRILRQSKGKKNMPITLSYVPTIALKTLKFEEPNRKNYFSSRLFYTHQLIIGRKFSENLSLQIMPSYVHRNLSSAINDPNDIISIGIGGRQKLTRRLSFNAEYYYVLRNYKLPNTTDALSLGFDIETGGHVFQLHFTNSRGMSERTFISETTGSWEKGDILFGFNISRVFTIGGGKKD
ncbi:MAG: DUF5777 family beta-barrel protein [Chitinophagaceae bacterium]